MKRFLIMGIIGNVVLSSACNQNASPETENNLPDIASIDLPEDPLARKMTEEYLVIMDNKMDYAAEIGRIHTRDQYVREVFIDMFSDPNLDPDIRSAFQKAGGEYVEAIDAINTAEFKVIMEDLTWRELAESESRLAERAFHIVQHSNDKDFRETTLAKIKPLVEEGLMDGQQFALMYDRVELENNRQQLYGTQTKCVNGQYDIHNLSDPETVEERRAKLGMEPLAPYINRLREHYGPCQDEK